MRLLQSLGLRFAQDKLHRKNSFFQKELCAALWVYLHSMFRLKRYWTKRKI
jgi:hypothetical protein